jgi:hypothetical protein
MDVLGAGACGMPPVGAFAQAAARTRALAQGIKAKLEGPSADQEQAPLPMKTARSSVHEKRFEPGERRADPVDVDDDLSDFDLSPSPPRGVAKTPRGGVQQQKVRVKPCLC